MTERNQHFEKCCTENEFEDLEQKIKRVNNWKPLGLPEIKLLFTFWFF